MSRSCSVGRPSSLLPCTCHITRTGVPSGRILVPSSSSLPIRRPTRRSKTANGIAARFCSSTDRFTRERLALVFGTNKYLCLCFTPVDPEEPEFYDQAHGSRCFDALASNQPPTPWF